MPLDRQTVLLLDAIRSLNLPDLSELDPPAARELSASRRATLPPGPEARVEDRFVPSEDGNIPIRIYRPLLSTESAVLPVLLWFHGGGFVIGSVHESDADCRTLANDAGIAVVSVEYRLAPEAPFPAAPNDCFAATRWVAEHARDLRVDPTRLAVGGDSAGANLAGVVSLMARDHGGPPILFQLLVYPVTDVESLETRSHHENAEGYFLTRKTMLWFRDQYVPNVADRRNPYASLLHAERLGGLPPALVMTAEFDPLRDEGEAFAARLRDAGGTIEHRRYDGTIHGFFSMNAFLDVGKRAMSDAAAALGRALGTSTK